mmetsp:Transcript_14487/g.20659  ORF Transcript_14487/g.20659 Transcript_14487/m.20659 type:complete len:83 (+) Transcript_14487:214-462(+)
MPMTTSNTSQVIVNPKELQFLSNDNPSLQTISGSSNANINYNLSLVVQETSQPNPMSKIVKLIEKPKSKFRKRFSNLSNTFS